MNILTQKGLGVKVSVKTVKKAVFVEGRPERSHKGIYTLTLAGSGKEIVAHNVMGANELYKKAYAMMQAYFPKAYEKFKAIAKANKAKANRRVAKKAVVGSDVKALLNLLRQGKGKAGAKRGNGKIIALFP